MYRGFESLTFRKKNKKTVCPSLLEQAVFYFFARMPSADFRDYAEIPHFARMPSADFRDYAEIPHFARMPSADFRDYAEIPHFSPFQLRVHNGFLTGSYYVITMRLLCDSATFVLISESLPSPFRVLSEFFYVYYPECHSGTTFPFPKGYRTFAEEVNSTESYHARGEQRDRDVANSYTFVLHDE